MKKALFAGLLLFAFAVAATVPGIKISIDEKVAMADGGKDHD